MRRSGGGEPFHLPASELEDYEGRLEFREARTETAPSAREPSSNNLVVFCEQEAPVDMQVVANHGYLTFQRT